jgi:hypothetical protein
MNPKWKIPRRKRAKKAKPFARRRRARLYRNGILSISRKTNACYLLPSPVQGVPNVVAGYGMNPGWFQIGTPNNVNGANYDIPFSMEFRLSDIVGFADIVNLCDDYKINNVKVTIYYNSNVAGVDTPASIPSIFYITDTDSSEVPTISAFRQRMGSRFKQFTANKPRISMKLSPRVAPLIYSSEGVEGYSIPVTPTWMNTAYPSVPHYSLKGYLSNVYLPSTDDKTQVSLFTFDITYNVTGKDFE